MYISKPQLCSSCCKKILGHFFIQKSYLTQVQKSLVESIIKLHSISSMRKQKKTNKWDERIRIGGQKVCKTESVGKIRQCVKSRVVKCSLVCPLGRVGASEYKPVALRVSLLLVYGMTRRCCCFLAYSVTIYSTLARLESPPWPPRRE